MPQILLREITKLNGQIRDLSVIVVENVHKAVTAILDNDPELAHIVIAHDKQIDNKEVQIEEECLKILALHQPVAKDLRYVVSILKVNNELERIGDLAVNIAERALQTYDLDRPEFVTRIREMAVKVQDMVTTSLTAMLEADSSVARSVLTLDSFIDKMHTDNYVTFKDIIQQNPRFTDASIQLLSVSRQLERIADHATNIAEDVIYMTEGDIVRHHHKPG